MLEVTIRRTLVTALVAVLMITPLSSALIPIADRDAPALRAVSAPDAFRLVDQALAMRMATFAGTSKEPSIAAEAAHVAESRYLLGIAKSDGSPVTRTLDAADIALASDAPSPAIAAERANIELSKTLLAINAQQVDAFAKAIASAEAVSAVEATRMGAGQPEAAVHHADPSSAIDALLSTRGVAASPDQRARIATLDGLGEPARSSLTNFLDAYAAFDATTEKAWAKVDMAQVASAAKAYGAPDLAKDAAAFKAELAKVKTMTPLQLANWHPQLPVASHAAAKHGWMVDLAPVLLSRNTLLQATLDLKIALGGATPRATMALVQVPSILSIDLDPTSSDTYTDDFALLVDAGGDDTYLNNAGGSNLQAGTCDITAIRGAAFLLDLGGSDVYGDATAPRSCGANGGAWIGGAGTIVDTGGADTFVAAGQGTNGGAYFGGVGMIVDAAGDSTYTADSMGANGGAVLGAGLIVDLAGNDVYSAVSDGANGGAQSGYVDVPLPAYVSLPPAMGAIVDGAGDDQYSASGSFAVGANGGALGADVVACAVVVCTPDAQNGAYGYLLDVAGADKYTAGSFGTNGAGVYTGVGFILDAQGNDVYDAGGAGANGGGEAGGTGALMDASGDDTYSSFASGSLTFGGNGGGDWFFGLCFAVDCVYEPSTGLLVDGGGSDHYSAGTFGANGGGGFRSGPSALIDLAGDDVYSAGSAGVNGGGYLWGNGFLFDAQGNDQYVSTPFFARGTSLAANGGGGFSGTGFLLDASGDDQYRGGAEGVNGAGVGWEYDTKGSAGFLADLAGNDMYAAGSQGANGGAYAYREDYGIYGYGPAYPGIGTLVDVSGDDSYTAGALGANGAASTGVIQQYACAYAFVAGACAMQDPSNPLVICEGVVGTCVGDPYADPIYKEVSPVPSSGLLVDGAGSDTYVDRDGGAGVDRSITAKGLNGQQLDMPIDVTQLRVPPTVPDGPGNVIGTPGPQGQEITLEWDAPTQNGGLAVTNYSVWRGTASGAETLIATLGDARSYEDKGLVPETTYYYQVRAANALGEGIPSAEAVQTAHFCGIVRDAAGYTCGQVPFTWLDTSGGTTVHVASFGMSGAITLPFSFPWYGQTKTTAYISSNGILCFQVNGCSQFVSLDDDYGFALPGNYAPNDLVACAWTLLNEDPTTNFYGFTGGGTITRATLGTAPDRTFVVEYNSVPQFFNYPGGTNTFQIQIHESGSAACMLNDIPQNNGSYPIGVGTENADGTIGLRYMYDYFGASLIGIQFSPP